MIRGVSRAESDQPVEAEDVTPSDSGDRPDDLPAARGLPGRLAGRSLMGQVYVLAIWPFFELLFNAAVGIVDTAIAGRLGEQSLVATDAIGVAAYVGWFMGMMHMAVGVGAGALIARAVGGGHRGLANAGLGQAVILAAVWGVFIGALVFALATPVSMLFGLEAESGALGLSTLYLRIVALSSPIASVLFVGNACLRAAGDTRTPFFVMLAVNVINTFVSWLLVLGPEPFGGHGVAGIAAGTTTAWTLGGLIVLGVLIRGKLPIRLRARRLRPHWHTMKRIVRVGIPSAVENSGMWVGNALVGYIVGLIATSEGVVGLMGAHIIAIRVESISFLPGVAMGTAAATLAGQYLGLGAPHQAKKAAVLSWMVAAALMTILGAIFIGFPEQLTWLISPEPDLYVPAADLVYICGYVQFFFASYIVLSSAVRGAGDTRSPMVITYAITFLVRLPAAYVIGYVLGYGLEGVWIALCGELALRGLVYIAWFYYGRWMRVKV